MNEVHFLPQKATKRQLQPTSLKTRAYLEIQLRTVLWNLKVHNYGKASVTYLR